MNSKSANIRNSRILKQTAGYSIQLRIDLHNSIMSNVFELYLKIHNSKGAVSISRYTIKATLAKNE